jgi:hypothetical protein
MAHGHPHSPHELMEEAERSPASPRERVLELGAVLLMSLAAVATAWSGYQAARWSGEQSQGYAQASATRTEAAQAANHSGQVRIDDLLKFDGWLNARAAGDRELQAIYEDRFRPAFLPAFRAWLGERPFSNGDAIPSPLYEPEYRLAALQHSRALDRKADGLYQEATDAKSNDDHYILSTVFFAAVLFFAGISLRLDWLRLRIAVLGFAAAMLIAGLTFIATLPIE